MAYTAWSVVYGEQPTAAKWNQLGTNDAGFKDGTNIDNLAILTRHLADGNATTAKVKLNAINYRDPVQGSNFTGTSAGYTTISGMSTTYVAGSTAERLFVWFNGMAQATNSSSAAISLRIAGVDKGDDAAWYPAGANIWAVFGNMYIVDVAAGSSTTFQLIYKGSIQLLRVGGFTQTSIKGFAISNV